MHPRRSSSALLFALLVLLVGFAAGCGGGGDGQSGGQQGGGNDQGQQGGGNDREERARPGDKIAPGTIDSVDPEARTLVLRPTRGELITFTIRTGTTIELDGEAADLANLREGQQAQVEYVVREGENRARRVAAFGVGETTAG